jgi:hypothetical protein
MINSQNVNYTIVREDLSLAELAKQIDAEHMQCEVDVRSALTHARMAGKLLQQAKAKVPRGTWLAWLDDNCKITPRSAQRYMRLVEKWADVVASGGEQLGLHTALELIADGPDGPAESNATRPSHLTQPTGMIETWLKETNNSSKTVENALPDEAAPPATDAPGSHPNNVPAAVAGPSAGLCLPTKPPPKPGKPKDDDAAITDQLGKVLRMMSHRAYERNESNHPLWKATREKLSEAFECWKRWRDAK